MSKILFFDDFPRRAENQLFMRNLYEKAIKYQLIVVNADAYSYFDMQMRSYIKEPFDIIILDIMAVCPPELAARIPAALSDDLQMGIALLYLLRVGEYGDHYKKCPIFMRSARGEARIHTLCLKLGATNFYRIGMDDERLIDNIVEYLETSFKSKDEK